MRVLQPTSVIAVLAGALCATAAVVDSLSFSDVATKVADVFTDDSSSGSGSSASAASQAISTVQSTPTTDSACVYDWASLSCTPTDACTLQYQFGDITPSQACRVNEAADTAKVPQQFHLAFAGTNAGEGMAISWTTYSLIDDPQVWVGSSESELTAMEDVAVETALYYEDDDYQLYNYHAVVTGLTAYTEYFYRVGSASNEEFQSGVSNFTTARASGDESTFEIAVYGDMGADANAVDSNQYVNGLVGEVDFVYHLGDVSYADNAFLTATTALGFFYEETYNRWMNSLTNIMRQVPYMVLVGNHEAECHSPACLVSSSKKDQLGNYSAFNTRWKMPSDESGGAQNMWYSYEYGTVHFTTISSETDYTDAPMNEYAGRTYGPFGDQLTWLENDLKAADANRANVPWLIVGMHRAIYTLRSCDADGTPNDEALPVQAAFEELFIKYNVDLVVSGHVHSYERHFPTARGVAVMDGVSSDNDTYVNPQAPVYVISGATGGPEGLYQYADDIPWPSWSAVMDNTRFSISKLKVTPTSLSYTTVDTTTGEIFDEFELTKD